MINSNSLPVKCRGGLLHSVIKGGSDLCSELDIPSRREQLERQEQTSRGQKVQFICGGTWFNRVFFFFLIVVKRTLGKTYHFNNF